MGKIPELQLILDIIPVDPPELKYKVYFVWRLQVGRREFIGSCQDPQNRNSLKVFLTHEEAFADYINFLNEVGAEEFSKMIKQEQEVLSVKTYG